MLTHTTRQIIKFSLTGGVNTAVDFAVLNLLIYLFGLTSQDSRYLIFKTISASVAILNSYLLNKWWVFKSNQIRQQRTSGEMVKFIGVSAIGLILNATIASLAFNALHPVFPSASAHMLANAGALTGTVIVMIFNFIGYKFLVFKPTN
jgi:putative flippase GtrA